MCTDAVAIGNRSNVSVLNGIALGSNSVSNKAAGIKGLDTLTEMKGQI